MYEKNKKNNAGAYVIIVLFVGLVVFGLFGNGNSKADVYAYTNYYEGTSEYTYTYTDTELETYTETTEEETNYNGTNPSWVTREYKWLNANQNGYKTYSLNLDANMYNHYSSLDRYYNVSEYSNYIQEPNNKELCKRIADKFIENAISNGGTKADAAYEAINFVQRAITYAYDYDNGKRAEYPKYPIETLYEGKGDCEDTTILLAGILSEMGYGVVILEYSDHVALGVLSSSTTGYYYTHEGQNYYYLETTGENWGIGEVPDQYLNVSAYVHEIY